MSKIIAQDGIPTIRIGNDISLTWTIRLKGIEDKGLENQDVSVMLIGPRGTVPQFEQRIAGSDVVIDFYGKDQAEIGFYSLFVTINKGKVDMRTKDVPNVFKLVPKSSMQNDVFVNSEVEVHKIDVESEVGFYGPSAYDIAVLRGFVGTEDEWLESLALHYDELTPEQIKELQKPATDAAEKVLQTDKSVNENEKVRQTNETNRQTNETNRNKEFTRLKNESETATRQATAASQKATEAARQTNATNESIKQNEVVRQKNETSRNETFASLKKESEIATRQTVEATGKCKTATNDANIAKDAANTSASNANKKAEYAETQGSRAKEYADHPTKMGDNGNWWIWNEVQKAYVDTGILAKGGVLYPDFYIDEETMELIMTYQDEVVADMFNIDEEGYLTFNPK